MCSLQPDTGPCKASFLSYYWNINTRHCERFVYGGCGANYNRFLDATSCASTCGKYIAKRFGSYFHQFDSTRELGKDLQNSNTDYYAVFIFVDA